jgi:N-formylglutamate deformylase
VVRAADAAGATPLVFDSPHSHAEWPSDIRTIAPPEAIASSCDMFVDELWSQATAGEVPLLAAGFHRAYIDANRPRDDIDATLLDSPWPGPAHPRSTSERGMGLIRRLALPGVPMYDRPLSLADVQGRIASCYDPYHAELDRLVSAAVARFGLAVHINCHSMKSVGNAMNVDDGSSRPDMVVSDLDGTSAPEMLVRWIVGCLRGQGYRVLVNHPYQGGEIVRRHARPRERRYSVQIEINRALYMDERRFEKHAGFGRLADDLSILVRQLRCGLESPSAPAITQGPLM